MPGSAISMNTAGSRTRQKPRAKSAVPKIT
jgi:hypothetical protein